MGESAWVSTGEPSGEVVVIVGFMTNSSSSKSSPFFSSPSSSCSDLLSLAVLPDEEVFYSAVSAC